MDKKTLDTLTGDELRKLIDPDLVEYESFHPEVKSIEFAWRLIDQEECLSKDRWESCILTMEQEELVREEQRTAELQQEIICVSQYHQYHHEEGKQPYWKQCVDNITKLLDN